MSYYNGRLTNHDPSPPSSSGAATPTSSVYGGAGAAGVGLSSSIGNVFSGLMRRFSGDTSQLSSSAPTSSPHNAGNGTSTVYMPPTSSLAHHQRRTPSPFRPPPLDPLVLRGHADSTPESARLLSAAVAEEVRIMVPARLQIAEDWRLVYGLERDGASLATLYQRCAAFSGQRVGFVLVVRDLEGGTFGAYMSEYPHPNPKYFGNGECFLWRASVLASLPPPPSADTSALAGRTTTISSSSATSFPTPPPRTYSPLPPAAQVLDSRQQSQHSSGLSSFSTTVPPPPPSATTVPPPFNHANTSASSLGAPTQGTLTTQASLATSTSSLSVSGANSPPLQPTSPPSIRFKAFPYSGENDYYMFCETHFLSLGAGDGHYGLWLDDGLGRGVSQRCDTFGNEPLSDEGVKFNVLGVEVWVVGAAGSW